MQDVSTSLTVGAVSSVAYLHLLRFRKMNLSAAEFATFYFSIPLQDVGASFAVGAVGSVAYLHLLNKSIDGLGSGASDLLPEVGLVPVQKHHTSWTAYVNLPISRLSGLGAGASDLSPELGARHMHLVRLFVNRTGRHHLWMQVLHP